MSDNFDFDLDDLDSFSMEGPGDVHDSSDPNDKRAVVTSVVRKFGSGVAEALDTDTLIDTAIENALPNELSDIPRDIIYTKMTVEDIYRDTVKELKPKVKKLSRLAASAMPDAPGLKNIKEKLLAFGEEDRRYAAEQSEEERILETIKGFLPQLSEGQTVKSLFEDAKEHKRWETELNALNAIAKNTSNIFRYESEFTYKYQTKSLELKYRMLITLEKLFELSKNTSDTVKLQLESIVKNTALPEVLKIKQTERFHELLRDSGLRSVQETMFGKGTWFHTLITNARNAVKEQVSNISDLLEMPIMMLEMQQDMAEQNREMGIEGNGIAGMAGGALTNRYTKKLAEKIRTWAENNPEAAEKILRISTAYRNMPATIADYISTKDDDSIITRIGEKFLELTSTTAVNTRVMSGTDLLGPAVYDNAARQSIVRIIPGYLKYIHGELTAIRSGGEPTYLEWSPGQEKFITSKELKSRISKNIRRMTSFADSSDIKELEKKLLGSNLSPEEKKRARSVIIETVANNTYFSEKTIRDALINAGFDLKTLSDKEKAEVANDLSKIRGSLPEIGEFVRTVIENGHGEYLDDLIVIKNGEYSINMDRYIKILTNNTLSKKERGSKNKDSVAVGPISSFDPADKKSIENAIERVGLSRLVQEGAIAVPSTTDAVIDLNKLMEVSSSVSAGTGLLQSEQIGNDTLTELRTQTSLLERIFEQAVTSNTQLTAIERAIIELDHYSPFSKETTEKLSEGVKNLYGSGKRVGSKIFSMAKKGIGAAGRLAKGALDMISPSAIMKKSLSSISTILAQISNMGAIAYNTMAGPFNLIADIGKSLLFSTLRAVAKIPGYALSAFNKTVNIGSKVAKALFARGNEIKDVYIDGVAEPALRASMIKLGMYVDVSTGKIIRSLRDITGRVVDMNGNIVLDIGDFQDGLVDAFGNKIEVGKNIKRGLFLKAKDAGAKLIHKLLGVKSKDIINIDELGSSIGKYSSKVMDKLSSINGISIVPGIDNLTTLAEERNKLLEKILDIMDGDNLRKGDFRTRLKKDEEEDAREKINLRKKITDEKRIRKITDTLSVFSYVEDLLGSAFGIAEGLGGAAVATVGGAYGLKKVKDVLGKDVETDVRNNKKASKKTSGKGIYNKLSGVGKVLKFGMKRMPFISALLGLKEALDRVMDGDFKGAAGELASGVVSSIPIVGTGAGLAIDAWLESRDMSKQSESVPLTSEEKRGLNALKYAMGAKKEHVLKLHPAVRSLFLRMVAEYHDLTGGKKIQVNSAWRSARMQRRTRERNKNAGGMRSMHTFGYAIDINTADANALEELGLMKKYGFTRPIGGETWHIEPAGLQMDPARAKNDPEWALRQIMLSPGHGGGGYGTIADARKKGRDKQVATMAFNAGPTKVTPIKTAKASGLAPTSAGIPAPAFTGPVQSSVASVRPLEAIEKPIAEINTTLLESLEVQKEILAILKDYTAYKEKEKDSKPNEAPRLAKRSEEVVSPVMSMRRTM